MTDKDIVPHDQLLYAVIGKYEEYDERKIFQLDVYVYNEREKRKNRSFVFFSNKNQSNM